MDADIESFHRAVDGGCLAGTVALALLTSAGQQRVEVLTEPEAHTKNACQDNA